MTDDIRVDGYRVRRSRTEKNRAPRWTAPVRLRSLVWIAVLGGLLWTVETYGTPHLRFQYTYRDRDAGDRGQRHYVRCDYQGLTIRTVIPENGVCPLFLLLK